MYNPIPYETQKQLAEIATAQGCEITVVAPVAEPRVEPCAAGTSWVTHYCMIFRADAVEETDGFIFKHQFTGRLAFRRTPISTWPIHVADRLQRVTGVADGRK